MRVPVTGSELSANFKHMIGTMRRGAKANYSVVCLHNQIKIIGIFQQYPDISSYTIDLTPDIARRFVENDLPSVVVSMKERFYKFARTSYKYTTPFEHHTAQTVFYIMTHTSIKILETVSCQQATRPSLLEFATTQTTQDQMQEQDEIPTPPILGPNTQLVTSDGQILMPSPPVPPLELFIPRKRSYSPE